MADRYLTLNERTAHAAYQRERRKVYRNNPEFVEAERIRSQVSMILPVYAVINHGIHD